MPSLAHLGRKSPIPRVPSPNPQKGGLSAGTPRISTSSRTSNTATAVPLKKSQADFEAALLNPNDTLFLSGSPLYEPIISQSDTPSGSASLGESANGSQEGQFAEADTLASLPVEKRSYEDDLRAVSGDSRTSAASESLSVSSGTGPQAGEARPSGATTSSTNGDDTPKRSSFGFVPTVPSFVTHGASPRGHARHASQATVRSEASGTSTATGRMSVSRISAASASRHSVGIDSELGEGHKVPQKVSKRRSMFKTQTTSSPDLAGMRRTAASNGGTSSTTGTMPRSTTANRDGRRIISRPAPPVPSSLSQASPSSLSRNDRSGTSGSALTGASTTRTISRSTAGESEDSWDKVERGSIGGQQRMPSIAERSPSARGSSRSREEGSKSLGKKARGMFGRMFGGGKDTSSPSPNNATAKRLEDERQYYPPVPAVPASYQGHAESSRSPTTDGLALHSDPIDKQATITPRAVTAARLESPLPSIPINASPPTPEGETGSETRSHSKESGSRETTPERSRSRAVEHGSPSSTLHPALDGESASVSDEPPSISPRRPFTMTFSQDMVGILDSITTDDQSEKNELSPPALQVKTQDVSPVTQPEEGAPLPRAKFPAELSKTTSSGRTSPVKSLASPQEITSSLNGQQPPAVASTTSVPDAAQSPEQSPQPEVSEQGTLAPPVNAAGPSRSSSSSSRKIVPTDHASQHVPSLAPPLSVPKGVREGEEQNGTIPETADPPVSVRLVPAANATTGEAETLTTSPSWDGEPPKRAVSPFPTATELSHGDSVEVVTSLPQPLEDDDERGRRLACEFVENDYSSVPQDKVAEFLGGPRQVNAIALKYYMSYFDMKGQSVVEAFRDLCAKLHLRAESQEIDRIIEAFSSRYFECNPATVFGTPGVVHTVTGAMLMLNTDLHIADLSKHMSRADFVRNAMRAIQESGPARPGISTPDLVRQNSATGSVSSSGTTTPGNSVQARPSTAQPTANRSASAPVVTVPAPVPVERSVSVAGFGLEGQSHGNSTTVDPFNYSKAWEIEAENALKDIYNQVRADKILLPIGNGLVNSNRHSVISLGSERGSSIRSASGRSIDRLTALKRGSVRGMSGVMGFPYNNSSFASSEGRLSPTPSHQSLITPLGEALGSIGFASNLSQAVIREHDDETRSVTSRRSIEVDDEELNDDELALLGPPWAKEGMLWKMIGGDRGMRMTFKKEWAQVFVVVQRGQIMIFTFGSGGGSSKAAERSVGGGSGAVGGGNWLNNANLIAEFELVHSAAHIVPGGYGRDRPYVFCLSVLTGEEIYLQAGTDDLAAEWVATCNYWAARRSRQPLPGGVSNMEYGWNKVLPDAENGNDHRPYEDDRASVRSNGSRFSSTYRRPHASAGGERKAFINDWKKPMAPEQPSTLDEEAQLEALTAYAKSLREELEQHRALEEPMLRLYPSHSKNGQKAMSNFNNKRKYLVAETFRYEGYVETLKAAIKLRFEKQGEKRLEKSLASSNSIPSGLSLRQ